MSNHLAIAATTATLRTLVSRAARVVPGAEVTTVRPDSIAGGKLTRGVNLYLYLVTHNGTFENDDVPTRRTDGTLATRPRVALDLHYLVSFYGDEGRLEPQLLLGSTLATLRQQPMLTPALIREAIGASTSPDLSGSDLDQQLPRVQVVAARLTPDELARLWPVFFQSPYLLSTVFQCSVVFVDALTTPSERAPVKKVDLTPEPMS
jgi:hypothetical protein